MSSRLRRPVTAALALALAAAGSAGLTATAAEQEPSVVATGLSSPRHLSFAPNGDLYVAESGAPSDSQGPCTSHPEFGDICLDDTSSVTKISRKGGQSRVVTGLPSIVGASEVNGAFDVVVHGSTLTIAMGLGGTPELRAALGPKAAPLGSVVDVRLNRGRGTAADVRVRADLVAYEAAHDPDGSGVDSNPVDLAQLPGGRVVAVDAGGNDALTVSRTGAVDTLAVFPSPGVAELPPFTGAPPGTLVPYQSVPTAAAKGPDGAWYVSELTGFPFPVGSANIYRVAADGSRTVYATGLTSLTDLAWDGDTLYAVQMADEGLLAGPSGSVVRVSPTGAHTTVADDLMAAYGIAIRDGQAYVTTGSVLPGGGQVISVPLG